MDIDTVRHRHHEDTDINIDHNMSDRDSDSDSEKQQTTQQAPQWKLDQQGGIYKGVITSSA